MNFDLDLLRQLAIPHFIIMGAITYFASTQPGRFNVAEIVALILGWLIPILGPIAAGIFVAMSRKRRTTSSQNRGTSDNA